MEDKIYVTGGHYGYRGSCTYEKIQVYKPEVNEWSIITIGPHPGKDLGEKNVSDNGLNIIFLC